ncbi:TPA: hypothetical protein QB407_001975, partial [Pasteurella multocida]|nr:hypothetical protein [Pasteurella multocida]
MKKLLKWIFIILFVFPVILGILASKNKNAKEDQGVSDSVENKPKVEQIE